MSNTAATLYDYSTGEEIRPATTTEEHESTEAAAHDGGLGLIVVDDHTCYVG